MLALAALAACAWWTGPDAGRAASSTVTVTFDVLSSTTLDTTSCTSTAATAFGSIPAGSTARTAAPCVVGFGSTNDSSELRVAQLDAAGPAMFAGGDGTLEGSFDGDGIGTYDALSGNGTDYAPKSVLQPDGKLVLAGMSPYAVGTVVRVLADGSLDPAFGGGSGRVSLTGITGGSYVEGIAVQPDGKILVAGHRNTAGDWSMLVIRLNADGSYDTTFDGDGWQVVDFGFALEFGHQVLVQSDGRILVTGHVGVDSSSYRIALARLTSAGAIDTTYGGGDGLVDVGIGVWAVSYDAVILPDDRPVLALAVNSPGVDFGVARFTTAGALDTTFDTDGWNTMAGTDWSRTLTRLGDGSLIVSGTNSTASSVAKFTSSGAVDTAFGGGDGHVEMDVAGTPLDIAVRTLERSDGKLWVVSTARDGDIFSGGITTGDVALGRLTSAGVVDTTYSGDGIDTFSLETIDDPWAAAMRPDESIWVSGRAGPTFGETDAFTMRLTTSGVPDTGYSGDGWSVFAAPSNYSAETWYGGDGAGGGSLVTFGRAMTPSASWNAALVRLGPTGVPDASFGGDGRALFDHASASDSFITGLVHSDGRVVGAGYASATLPYVVRVLADGTPDPDFGSGGSLVIDIPGATRAFVYEVAEHPDGGYVVAGDVQLAGAPSDTWIARITEGGTLDTSFGSGGIFIHAWSANTDNALAMGVAPDGGIIAGGGNNNGTADEFVFLRVDEDGVLDTSWGGGDGLVTIDHSAGADTIRGLEVSHDGSVTGFGRSEADFAVVRLDPAGVPEAGFGSGGVAVVSIGAGNDYARSGTRQGDGRIVVAGSTTAATEDYALARLMPDGTLDTSWGGGDGIVEAAIGPGHEYGRELVKLADGDLGLVGWSDSGNGHDDLAVLVLAGGTTIADHTAGAWSSGSSFFGACLEALAGATADWVLDADSSCTADDADPWRAIPASSASATRVAHTLAAGSATAQLRFGVGVAASQEVGAYMAPLRFEVIAPAA